MQDNDILDKKVIPLYRHWSQEFFAGGGDSAFLSKKKYQEDMSNQEWI